MLRHLATLIILSALASVATAGTVFEQSLPAWSNGYCSPCGAGTLSHRVFASFTLDEATLLEGGEFAVLDTSPFGAQDISISIWDVPQGNQLFSASFASADYTRVGSASTHRAVVELPAWLLGPGSYWISLFGINGNQLSWGSDRRAGDDAQYRGDGTLYSDVRYVGFSLQGVPRVAAVPLPGTLPLFGIGLLLIGLVRRRHF